MPIPYRFNPMGKSNKPTAFELEIYQTWELSYNTFGFVPYWDIGGYCSVDWGDGSKEEAVTSGWLMEHIYPTNGSFKIKIKAECYRVDFSYNETFASCIKNCSFAWDCLGTLSDYTNMFNNCKNAEFVLKSIPAIVDGYDMFNYCSKAKINLTNIPSSLVSGERMFNRCEEAQMYITNLPESLLNGGAMFGYCKKSTFKLKELPNSLQNGGWMFKNCEGAEINLSELAANAPSDGYSLTTIESMFYGCPKVTGSRSAFLAKCPNVTTTTDAFTGTNTTE